MHAHLERVMNYVRRDGPLTAPVCFLTIEDGGRSHYESVDDFVEKSLRPDSEVWERTTIKTELFGKPGQFMAKLMLAIFTGSLDGWQRYRDGSLHVRNEANVKFYPIPRRGKTEWQEVFSDAIGLSEREYIAQCRAKRPIVIYKRWEPLFQADRLHLILGAKAEWTEFFRMFLYTDALPSASVVDARGRTKYAIHRQPNESLAFGYFDIFRPGCRNDDARDFADALRPYLSDDLKRRVEMNH